MNLTRLYKERKKERRVIDKENEERRGKSGVGALSVEIRTVSCSKSITLYAPIQPFCCGAIEPKPTKPHRVSVCQAIVCDTSV